LNEGFHPEPFVVILERREGGNMNDTVIDRPLLGTVLVAERAVDESGVYQALRQQIETREPIGEILVGLGLICRPQLDRALAHQAGFELRERTGFGTGLRLEIERRHEIRRAPFGA
jgi:hypothetical protein